MPSLAPPAPPQGWQGLLQNLTSGLGAIDLPGLINNAQKWVGMLNQLGSVIKQAAPLLQLIQGLSQGFAADDDDLLEEWDEEGEKKKKKKKRSKQRKGKQKNKTASKKRKVNKQAS